MPKNKRLPAGSGAGRPLYLKGAEAYARCVQDAIDRLEAGTDEYIFDFYGPAE